MREDTLTRFFVGEVVIDRLAEDVSHAVTRHDPVRSTIEITDMDETFVLTREHLVRLCDAKLSNSLTAEALSTIAFAIIASDHFEWEDDVISEVLHAWSSPEINSPLNGSTLSMHRDWLSRIAEPSPLTTAHSDALTRRIVSETRKA